VGLRVTGVVGILIRAWHRHSIPSLTGAIEDLQVKAGFHLGKELLAEVLKESNGLFMSS